MHKSERVTKEFSYNEFVACYSDYRRMFREKLNKPSADSNHIINFDL